MPIHEGLCPKPGAKQTTKKRENQFHEDVMGPTSEVVEPPAQFECTRGYEHMNYEQPMLQVLPTEEIMSHKYVHHRIMKEPLSLFFVDLEPAGNNKNIYDIMALQNKVIQIEPLRINKRNIPQCARCQQYGHTRTYCNKPFACQMRRTPQQ
jgi:hypothetical protein